MAAVLSAPTRTRTSLGRRSFCSGQVVGIQYPKAHLADTSNLIDDTLLNSGARVAASRDDAVFDHLLAHRPKVLLRNPEQRQPVSLKEPSVASVILDVQS